MSTERDELAVTLSDAYEVFYEPLDWHESTRIADAILAAGYRKIFDGDCGLSNVKDPTEREAAEAWMRWANLAMNDEIGAIGAMKQMLIELGYRRPRTITTAEELDALPEGAVIRDNDGDVFEAVRCTGDAGAGIPDYNCWDQIAETWPLDSDKIALPAVVLDEADQ